MDERLSGLLTEMKAKMPDPNPSFDPKIKPFATRKSTVALATKKRRIEEAQVSNKAETPPAN